MCVCLSMYSATSLIGMCSFPPAAFSCPPPLKKSLAHLLAEVPLFDLMDILTSPDSSLAKMLILTFPMLSGSLTNPSVSPSCIL